MAEPIRWTEISFSADGVSVTLYEDRGNDADDVIVVDEAWFTFDELENQSDNVVLSDESSFDR